MMKQLLLALMFLSSTGFCALHDHLKTVDGNPDLHSMRNIDFIYMINLDQRPEKWESSKAQLLPYGIHPYRFSAVNGWELTLEDIDDVGVKFQKGMKTGIMGTCYHFGKDFDASHQMIDKIGQVYFSHCMSRGAIGIVLSHLSILQDAYDKGYGTIWVMEDDIEPVQDPRMLSDIIDRLDRLTGDRWDILFTDQDTRNKEGKYIPCLGHAHRPDFEPSDPGRFKARRDIGEFRKIGARFGAYSMILRRSGIAKILEFYKTHNVFLPYDFEFFIPKEIRIYTVIDDVVRHKTDATSDNGAARYKERLIQE